MTCNSVNDAFLYQVSPTYSVAESRFLDRLMMLSHIFQSVAT